MPEEKRIVAVLKGRALCGRAERGTESVRGQRGGRPGHGWEGCGRGGQRRRGASGTSVPVTAVPRGQRPGARGAPPPGQGAISALSTLGGSHRGSRERSEGPDGGGRWLQRAGGRTPTLPAPALRLPEAEGERGRAWETAAAPEEEEEAEGEEPLAAARARAARGEPAGAGECVQARARRGRPPCLRPAGPRRPPPSPGRAPAPRPTPPAPAPLSPAPNAARPGPGRSPSCCSQTRRRRQPPLPGGGGGGGGWGWVSALVEVIWGSLFFNLLNMRPEFIACELQFSLSAPPPRDPRRDLTFVCDATAFHSFPDGWWVAAQD